MIVYTAAHVLDVNIEKIVRPLPNVLGNGLALALRWAVLSVQAERGFTVRPPGSPDPDLFAHDLPGPGPKAGGDLPARRIFDQPLDSVHQPGEQPLARGLIDGVPDQKLS